MYVEIFLKLSRHAGSTPATSTIEKSSRTLCGFCFFNGGTKSQDFTSLREAQLHSKNEVFSSHLHLYPEVLLVKSFHYAYAPLHL